LTREDIFSTFLQDYYPNYRTFIDHRRRTVVRSAPTVKDVCGRCNNELLSRLDSYAAQSNRRYFSLDTQAVQTIEFEYDYHRWLRWLMKVWYNDARAQRRDIPIHRDFAPYILGHVSEPPYAVSVLAGLLPPFRVPVKTTMGTPQVPKVLRLAHVTLTDP